MCPGGRDLTSVVIIGVENLKQYGKCGGIYTNCFNVVFIIPHRYIKFFFMTPDLEIRTERRKLYHILL